MRIGIDVRLPFYQMGGISQYTLALVDALALLPEAAAHSFVLFQSRKDGRSYVPDTGRFRRRDLWTPCHHPLERWALSAELLPHRLDVFHSPDFIPPRRAARRQIITVHDLNFWYFPEFLTAESRRYYRDQIAWAVARADAIAADSEHTRRDLIERLGVDPTLVTTIPLAANPLYLHPPTAQAAADMLAALGLPSAYLLFVGTLEPRKNVPLLLEAYALLRRDHGVDLPLLLVGRRGWLDEEIFATIERLALGEAVIHLDSVDNPTLAALYRRAALLALPSHYEGFGLPPLEAMHCGCPVVVSDRASLREVVGEAGLRLAPEGAAAWAAAMARLLQDSGLRAELIERGYAQAAHFTWEATARATLRLYIGA